jgi:hypothetical protein
MKETLEEDVRFNLKFGEQYRPSDMQWIWRHVIPLGKLGFTYGPQHGSKSPLWTDLVARVTSGKEWPDGSPNTFGPRSVIMMSREDDPSEVVIPRLHAAGAVVENVAFVESTTFTVDTKPKERYAALSKDIGALINTLKAWPEEIQRARLEDLRLYRAWDQGEIDEYSPLVIRPLPLLLIIDPLSDYLGGAKLKDEEVIRPMLNNLKAVCERFHQTAIVIGHFNKTPGHTNALNLVMGCAAMTGVPRFGFFVKPDKAAGEFAHEMVPARQSNSAWKGIKFATEAKDIECPFNGKTIPVRGVVCLKWGGEATGTAEDLLSKPESTREASDNAKAAECIKDFLQAGKRTATECEQWLEGSGFAYREEVKKMTHCRIRKLAGVKTEKGKGGQWWWYLPAAQDQYEIPVGRKGNEGPEY